MIINQTTSLDASFLLLPSPGVRCPLGVILYLTPFANIVIISPIHFISHCPLEQHVYAFIYTLGT